MKITHRQLKYFVEIARTGSITTAATTLRIAQPALSHHIAAIEEELGVTLFERHARGVRLTAEGQRLLERSRANPGVDDRPLIESANVSKGSQLPVILMTADADSRPPKAVSTNSRGKSLRASRPRWEHRRCPTARGRGGLRQASEG